MRWGTGGWGRGWVRWGTLELLALPPLTHPAQPPVNRFKARWTPTRPPTRPTLPPTHLEVALPVIQEALGEHLVHAGVCAVHVRRLGVAVVHLEHAAGGEGEGGKVGRK